MTKALTVWQLRELLANVDGDTFVVIASDAWYSNIEAVQLPDGEGWEAVTLFSSSAYDTRQGWEFAPADIR